MSAAVAAVLAKLRRALVTGGDWRVLLVWAAAMLIPTLLTSFPVNGVLTSAFGRSVHAAEIARGFDFLAMSDAASAFDQSASVLGSTIIVSTVVALLLSPFLTGVAITASRASAPLGFVDLALGGVREYARLLRLWLVALLPLALAGFVASLLLGAATRHGEHATLQSSAESATRWATIGAVLLVGVAHLTVEAGRARVAAEPSLRSAFVAWWRGLGLLRRRPVAAVVLYLVPTILGGAFAFLLSLIRVRVVPATVGSAFVAFILTQLTVAAIAWGRVSRLHALHELTRDEELGDAVSSGAVTPAARLERAPNVVAARAIDPG